jgi:hypothetical protein
MRVEICGMRVVSRTLGRAIPHPAPRTLGIPRAENLLPVEDFNRRWRMSDDEVKMKSNKVIYLITFNNFVSVFCLGRGFTRRPPGSLVTGRNSTTKKSRSGHSRRHVQQSLANELQNIPLPAFEGYLQVLEQIKLCIRRNESMHLIIGGMRSF